jgi:hypothetical protein
MTWAADNNTYTTWETAAGSAAMIRNVGRSSAWRITGDPPSLTTFNILGCKSDGTGCTGTFTHDAACDASYASTLALYGSDILAIDNTLFSIGWSADPAVGEKISYSTDFGQTWTQNSWSWPRSAGSWVPISFIKSGMAYTDNAYIYIVGVRMGIGLTLSRQISHAGQSQRYIAG